jgi:hypothetical protein
VCFNEVHAALPKGHILGAGDGGLYARRAPGFDRVNAIEQL